MKYSGEACVQERITINSTGNKTIGRYCGRRYQWSVFISIAPIILRFHTVNLSSSYFELQYQITNLNLTSYMVYYKTYSEFKVIENNSFLFPFSWIHKFVIRNDIYYNWNIFVPKIHKLSLKLRKGTNKDGTLYLYDGPDYYYKKYDFTTRTTFTSSSFQASVLFHCHHKCIELDFRSYFVKSSIQNYKSYFVHDRLEMKSRNLKCANNSSLFCAFNFNVNRFSYVNATLSFKYSGPNVGYCKYGGFSVYDYIDNALTEVLLSCDNWYSVSSRSQFYRNIVSSTESLLVVFYSYFPYSEIKVQLSVEPSSCQGVHLQR